MNSDKLRKALDNSGKYQVRWSYTSTSEPTFGRYCTTFERAMIEVENAIFMGMTYIDIVHPDGKVEIKKSRPL
jgi:hypothetical protein